ncbi:MAG: F0F1 ATP synthase subunit B [Actinomycetaceae bacterium]|nr:F0F1 ATP synthase subunit B [Arcanobacterium sp.]MDD7687476.1 F0F1 ATP synthase subunit B [Actinomycetaceae bacterium]MDY5272951.1 F0F1 ATP synthase subunit B [Arcanobacterium sp.]
MALPLFQEAAAGAESFNIVLPALPDLIWGTVAFVIVAVAVYKLAWPAFSATLDERREKIEHGLRAAEIAREEVAREREDLAGEVDQARIEASDIREKAQANAKNIVADAQAKARSEADGILDAAHVRIAADADAAKRTLQDEVGLMATELAGRIVGEAIADEALARRVIDRFISELETADAPEGIAATGVLGQESA